MTQNKSYRLKPDLSREQLEGLLDALLPFYGFGSVLTCAGSTRFGADRPGEVAVTLYAGRPAETQVNKHGVAFQNIPLPDDYANETTLYENNPEGCLLGAAGFFPRIPASFMSPTLTLGDFHKAYEVFMECSEAVEE